MYKIAYRYSDEVVFYFDHAGNKYVASGGSLAWRLNNPGLLRSHSHFSRSHNSIGSCGGYAIFSHPEEGHKALAAWLHTKKYYLSSLRPIGEHYRPKAPDLFVNELSALTKIAPDTKIKLLNPDFRTLNEESIDFQGLAKN